jgi:hypothetical protein
MAGTKPGHDDKNAFCVAPFEAVAGAPAPRGDENSYINPPLSVTRRR